MNGPSWKKIIKQHCLTLLKEKLSNFIPIASENILTQSDQVEPNQLSILNTNYFLKSFKAKKEKNTSYSR